MWKASARPRQVGRVDAGPEECLGSPQSARRVRQPSAEFAEIVRDTIGELVVGPGPHVLGRIELRGVRREVVHVKAGMAGQERADLATAMDRAAIPQQVDGTAELAEQMLEEGADIDVPEFL